MNKEQKYYFTKSLMTDEENKQYTINQLIKCIKQLKENNVVFVEQLLSEIDFYVNKLREIYEKGE